MARARGPARPDGTPKDYRPFVPPERGHAPGARYAPRHAAAHHGTNEAGPARPLPYDPRGGPPRNSRWEGVRPAAPRRPLPRREPFEAGLTSQRPPYRQAQPFDGSTGGGWQQPQPQQQQQQRQPWREHADRGAARWRTGGRRNGANAEQHSPGLNGLNCLNGWADGRSPADGLIRQRPPPPKRPPAPRPPPPPQDTRVMLPEELTVKTLADKLGADPSSPAESFPTFQKYFAPYEQMAVCA